MALGFIVELLRVLRALSYDEAKELWRCSDRLAEENYARLQDMCLEDARTAAVIAYEGIQYQHLATQVMSEGELGYLGKHLRILSGFYGVLRPFDAVVPYRLEMQTRLPMPACEGHPATRNLYEWWGDTLARTLAEEFDTVVNIASVEYAKAVTTSLPALGTRIVTCLFGTLRASDGKLLQRSTEAKAARGTFEERESPTVLTARLQDHASARKITPHAPGRHRADKLHAVDSVEDGLHLTVPDHEQAYAGEVRVDAPKRLRDHVNGLERQKDAGVHERERCIARREIGGRVGQHIGTDGAFLGTYAIGAKQLRCGAPEEEPHARIAVHEPSEEAQDGAHEPAGTRTLRHGEPRPAVPPAPKHDAPRDAVGEGGNHLNAHVPVRHRRARGGNR